MSHNLRPGVAERLQMGYETIRALNPSVVYAYTPGWGSTGPDIGRPGFAPLFSGYAGLHYEAAGEGNVPVPPVGNEDNGNGLLGAAAILMALYHRRRSGQGQYLEHPQLNATLLMAMHLMGTADGAVAGSLGLDAGRLGPHPLDRLYRTADGWLCLCARTDAEFGRLGSVAGLEHLGADARFAAPADRDANAAALAALLEAAFAGSALRHLAVRPGGGRGPQRGAGRRRSPGPVPGRPRPARGRPGRGVPPPSLGHGPRRGGHGPAQRRDAAPGASGPRDRPAHRRDPRPARLPAHRDRGAAPRRRGLLTPGPRPGPGGRRIGYVAPMGTDGHRLGASSVSVPPLGVGTWAWGDRSTWGMGGYDAGLTTETIREAWEASIDAGVAFFDTAEVYGRGESERIIGAMLAADPARAGSVVIGTKFMPVPWKLAVGPALLRSLRASLERLGLPAVDLYQIHGPISLRSHAALADALAAAHQEGLVRAVGVSNYSVAETRSMAAALGRRGLQLATNQIEFSLLRRRPETGGLLAACRELGVLPLAYSPIGQGRLTGKYSASNPPPGKRNFSKHPMAVVDGVVDELRRIGEKHGGKLPSQVALNWVMAKGAVPIPGAKNRRQAEENAGALGWHLDDADLARLDAAALEGVRSLTGRFWQHG